MGFRISFEICIADLSGLPVEPDGYLFIFQVNVEFDLLGRILCVCIVLVVSENIQLTEFHFHQPFDHSFGWISLITQTVVREVLIIIRPVGLAVNAHVEKLQSQYP